MTRLFAVFCLYFICSSQNSIAQDAEVQKILSDWDRTWVDRQSYAEVKMVIVTQNYTRELALKYWGKGKNKTLIRIVAPPKENGVTTLKVDGQIYNYLPNIARTVKVNNALLGKSWMGSHFTNSDLIRSTRFSDDYHAKLLKKTVKNKAELWTILTTAKPKTVTPWKTIKLIYNKTHRLPVQQSFYNKKKKLVRSIRFSKPKNFGGKLAPSVVVVTPHSKKKKGENTTMIYEKIDRKTKIDDEIFELSSITNY